MGESAASIVKRHALIACRLAGIYTILRYYEQQLDNASITCADEDFGNALWLIEQSLESSMNLYRTLPGEEKERKTADKKLELISALPEFFTFSDLLPILKQLHVSERTASRWLKDFVNSGILLRLKPGEYQKSTMAINVAAAASID